MARRRYLVAYDIRDEKRLRGVHKAMKGFGDPLQYSVFVCDLNKGEKLHMMEALGGLIRHSEDSIAIMDLGEAEVRGTECFKLIHGRVPPTPSAGPKGDLI